ncbi:MAG: MXAN_6521/LA_1396 family lipoprotein [Myxococcales bacterium]|nr:MXAN_6521/LA_1396 family lipoprotein [Myxococcales bacterium]
MSGAGWRRALLCGAALGGLAACSPVKETWVRPDYKQVDRTKTLRISVVTAPAPAGEAKLGELWSALARTYINQHRDFIVVEDYTDQAVPADVCNGNLEGFLHFTPTVKARAGGAEAALEAVLVRCHDREPVWRASAAGDWDSDDDDLDEAKRHWTGRFGDGIAAWVVPSYRLITGTCEALPEPELPTEAYIREKIQLGE